MRLLAFTLNGKPASISTDDPQMPLLYDYIAHNQPDLLLDFADTHLLAGEDMAEADLALADADAPVSSGTQRFTPCVVAYGQDEAVVPGRRGAAQAGGRDPSSSRNEVGRHRQTSSQIVITS